MMMANPFSLALLTQDPISQRLAVVGRGEKLDGNILGLSGLMQMCRE